MILGHVDAVHWWGPLGWLYRNTPGNLAASVIAFTAGYLVKGRSIVRGLHAKLDAHHGEQMAAQRRTHRHLGIAPEPKGSSDR